jgi:hypothetical protein
VVVAEAEVSVVVAELEVIENLGEQHQVVILYLH